MGALRLARGATPHFPSLTRTNVRIVLTTNQKGSIAEQAIALEATRLGIEVYRPVAEGGRFDLIFAFEDASLARVQCKWAPRSGDVITVRTTPADARATVLVAGTTPAMRLTRSLLTAQISTAATTCRAPSLPGGEASRSVSDLPRTISRLL
jgi:PD-(D/E)XK endonuclease